LTLLSCNQQGEGCNKTNNKENSFIWFALTLKKVDIHKGTASFCCNRNMVEVDEHSADFSNSTAIDFNSAAVADDEEEEECRVCRGAAEEG
jgi:hypothetical protein